jgi:hypothetical protein
MSSMKECNSFEVKSSGLYIDNVKFNLGYIRSINYSQVRSCMDDYRDIVRVAYIGKYGGLMDIIFMMPAMIQDEPTEQGAMT